MEPAAGLICVKCRRVLGNILNPSSYLAKDCRVIKAICIGCVVELSREKAIVPDGPENWARPLEGLL
jgi:hypothetical protein